MEPTELSWLSLTIGVVAAVVLAVVIAAIVAAVVRLVARRRGWATEPTEKLRAPFRTLLLIVLLWIAVAVAFPREAIGERWYGGIEHAFRLATIAAGAWLVSRFIGFLFERTLSRYRIDVADNRVARRVHTQLAIIRRLTVVAIVIIAIGAILLTFPGVQAVGASLLASAGLASVVAGLAAQSTLANVFAGLQLAFSDAIRVDDVVIAEGQWGKIEEITLTYVVVRIWDDRRLVLPSTYFTTTPFENWTRRGSELLGSVEIDLDWRVNPAGMRERLDEILAETELWDGRVKVLQITDAVGGFVRVRVLVTASDAATLFDLRCLVREELVEWVHTHNPTALPRDRVQVVEEAEEREAPQRPLPMARREGLFTGSDEAEERAHQFTSSIPLPQADQADPSREVSGDVSGRDDPPRR